MKYPSSLLALALTVALPAVARAEPVSISLQSVAGGATGGASGVAIDGFSIDLGTIFLPASGSAIFAIDGLRAASDYTVTLAIAGLADGSTLNAEVLDPINGDDGLDPADQPSYVPSGYSTSNNFDGLSFAQGSNIDRSATFDGGAATVTADENTNRGDLLSFVGLGTGTAAVTFGLRDRVGDRNFLVRINAFDGTPNQSPVPEPASMLLMGTGLAGLVVRRRKHTTGA